MTALAQGSAGVALVTCLALLPARQNRSAVLLLAIQSGAAAVAAIGMRHPVLALTPLLFVAGLSAASTARGEPALRDVPLAGSEERKPANPTLCVAAGFGLAVLCQSQGVAGVPLAVVLLAMLFAATHRQPFAAVVATATVSNGVTLLACLLPRDKLDVPALLPLACLLLPAPLAAGLMIPHSSRPKVARLNWSGRADLGIASLILAATFIVPLDPVATVFAPLLALDGLLRSCRRRKRDAVSPAARALALTHAGLAVLAVSLPSPIGAWLAVLAAIATSAPLMRRANPSGPAFLGAGLVLFGLLLAAMPNAVGYFCVFVGSVMIGAAVPDLAVVLVILLLRLANQAAWPPLAETLGIGIALSTVLACAARLLLMRRRPHTLAAHMSAVTLLQASQAAIAALAICTGEPDGRFAALVLLALLILTRSAARATDLTVMTLAMAGLGGAPPAGVFPGVVLVVLALASHAPWLLLPLGAAAMPMLAASLATLPSLAGRFPAPRLAIALPSIGWLPLILAALAGYCAPEGLVRWCLMLTAGH